MTRVGKEDLDIRARDSERFVHYRVVIVNLLSLILVTLPMQQHICDAIDDYDGCGCGDDGNHNSSLHHILNRAELLLKIKSYI